METLQFKRKMEHNRRLLTRWGDELMETIQPLFFLTRFPSSLLTRWGDELMETSLH